MRLQEIHIRGYHVLDHFSLFLSEEHAESQVEHALDLIVGVNGSGKSSLLRALADIFQALYRGEQPTFGFCVKYQLRGKERSRKIVMISNLDENDEPRLGQPFLIQIDAEEEKEVERIDREDLPDRVIALTSGSEKGWRGPEAEEKSVPSPSLTDAESRSLADWYRQELANISYIEQQGSGPAPHENRYLFLRADLMPLVVLCGLLQDMSWQGQADHPKFIDWALGECRLKSLSGFSLKFRMNVLDPRDRDFIERLREKAQHSIQRGSDHLLVFSLAGNVVSDSELAPGMVRPAEVLATMATCLDFFQKLVELQKPASHDPILREVNLFFSGNRRRQNEGEEAGQSPLQLFDWLSDGEQSFLGRLCLFALLEPDLPPENTSGDGGSLASEALILLDEPEVHFNDYWKRQLVRMLTEALQGTPRHVLMTTHSSITLSDVADENVRILQRDDDYTSYADPPGIRTLGADPSDILVAVFRAENAVGEQGVRHIRRKIQEARSISMRDATEALRTLRSLFDELGPGYWRYLVRREIDALEGQER